MTGVAAGAHHYIADGIQSKLFRCDTTLLLACAVWFFFARCVFAVGFDNPRIYMAARNGVFLEGGVVMRTKCSF